MEQYLIGLDNGGTTIKCAVFDLHGTELGIGSRSLPLSTPHPGWTERNCMAVWKANVEAIRDAIAKAKINPAQIIGVGLTGYGNGACFTDARGIPVYPCIVSTDSRANEYLTRWEKDGTIKAVYERTWQKIWDAQPAALIPWFRDQMPQVLDHAAYTLDIKDYIRFCLTGVLCGEITAASSGCLMNLKTREFDREIFKILGIEKYFGINPPYIESTAISGRVTREAAALTGIPEGVPVSGGYFDIDAGALASGVLTDDILCLIAGTWSINEYITPDLAGGYGKFSNTMSYLPEWYTVEDSSPTSASNFDWFIDRFLAVDFPHKCRSELLRECDQRVAKLSASESNAIFVPYLYASATNPLSKGAFFGLSGYHTRDHVLRAVYEGVVLSSVFHVKRLTNNREGQYKAARFSGGVAKSPFWTQMLCDALQLPLETLCSSELSAMGAAMSAGIACGAFSTHEKAVAAMVHTAIRYEPNPQMAGVYAKKYKQFERAIRALDFYHSES